MFKLRRRSVAETAATGQPLCTMCGTTTRVDPASGRCALGHRVVSPGTLAETVAVPAEDLVTAPLEAAALEPTTDLSQEHDYEPAGVFAGEGLYEAYQSADAAGRTVTWDDVVAPSTSGGSNIYDDYLAWDEPASAFSSLDMDTADLPVADEDVVAQAPSTTPIDSSDLLDELDDDAYARRRTVGTLGATVAITGMLAAAVAILPI